MAKTDPAVELKCPRCRYSVEEPGAARCPRCYSALSVPACCRGDCRNCGGHRQPGPEECKGRD